LLRWCWKWLEEKGVRSWRKTTKDREAWKLIVQPVEKEQTFSHSRYEGVWRKQRCSSTHLNFGIGRRRVVNFTHWPLYPRQRTPLPNKQKIWERTRADFDNFEKQKKKVVS
jgi:hypothetical protein